MNLAGKTQYPVPCGHEHPAQARVQVTAAGNGPDGLPATDLDSFRQAVEGGDGDMDMQRAEAHCSAVSRGNYGLKA